ncbi:hypothetical protein BDW75DRAFT_224432 [Aspergillus navahoensis]
MFAFSCPLLSLSAPLSPFLARAEHFPIGLDDALPSIVRFDLYFPVSPVHVKSIGLSHFAHHWRVGDNALPGDLKPIDQCSSFLASLC